MTPWMAYWLGVATPIVGLAVVMVALMWGCRRRDEVGTPPKRTAREEEYREAARKASRAGDQEDGGR